MSIIRVFLQSNISFVSVKETSHGDVFVRPKNICYYRHLLKYIMKRSYCLNSVCPKRISNKRVCRKTAFEFSKFSVL